MRKGALANIKKEGSMAKIDGDLALGLGIAAIVLAVAFAVYVGKSQQRLCIREHGTWKNDTCEFRQP